MRAPRFPDPDTDQGTHRFRYALCPGATITDAIREGYRINLPERVVAGSQAVESLVRLDDVVVEAGGRAQAQLTMGFNVADVAEVDLLERHHRSNAPPTT